LFVAVIYFLFAKETKFRFVDGCLKFLLIVSFYCFFFYWKM